MHANDNYIRCLATEMLGIFYPADCPVQLLRTKATCYNYRPVYFFSQWIEYLLAQLFNVFDLPVIWFVFDSVARGIFACNKFFECEILPYVHYSFKIQTVIETIAATIPEMYAILISSFPLHFSMLSIVSHIPFPSLLFP